MRSRSATLLGALLALAAPAVAAPEPPLALLQEGQGLALLSRRSTDVAASPDGRHVYAACGLGTLAFRREADGKLAFVEEYPLNTPETRVVVPADGLGVLAIATSAGVGGIVSFLRNGADGKLTFVEAEAENLQASAYSLAVSHDGRRVYVTSPGQDAVVVQSRDPQTGVLAFVQRIRASDPGVSGLVDPTWIAVSPDDQHVYVTAFAQDGAELRPTIVLLRREPDDTLAFAGALETGALAAGAIGLGDLLVAPDGAEVLALDSGALPGGGAALLRFARDGAGGQLAFTGKEPFEASGFFAGVLNWMALRPDGRRVFSGGLRSTPAGGVALTHERAAGGALTPLASLPIGAGGLVVTSRGVVSPDGRYVYTSEAQGVRVLVPEPRAAALGAAAVLALSRRRARRARPPVRASARA